MVFFFSFLAHLTKCQSEPGEINAEGCRIQVPMHWNVPLFKELLVGYHDQQLVQFIEFGWPITPEQLCKHQVSGLPHNQAGPGLIRLN